MTGILVRVMRDGKPVRLDLSELTQDEISTRAETWDSGMAGTWVFRLCQQLSMANKTILDLRKQLAAKGVKT